MRAPAVPNRCSDATGGAESTASQSITAAPASTMPTNMDKNTSDSVGMVPPRCVTNATTVRNKRANTENVRSARSRRTSIGLIFKRTMSWNKGTNVNTAEWLDNTFSMSSSARDGGNAAAFTNTPGSPLAMAHKSSSSRKAPSVAGARRSPAAPNATTRSNSSVSSCCTVASAVWRNTGDLSSRSTKHVSNACARNSAVISNDSGARSSGRVCRILSRTSSSVLSRWMMRTRRMFGGSDELTASMVMRR